VAGALEDGVERLVLEVDRDEADLSGGWWQVGEVRALFTLSGRMIDLEDFQTYQLAHAPGASVVTGAEDDELRCASGDRIANCRVDGRGPKGDHVRHHPRHFDPDATRAFSSSALGLGKTPLSLLAEKDARRRVVEIRDVREPGVGECAAVGDEVSSPAGAFSFHNDGVAE